MNEWLGGPIGLLIRQRLCYAVDRTGQDRYDSLIVFNHDGFTLSNPSSNDGWRGFHR
jgi:hypothetical protein